MSLESTIVIPKNFSKTCISSEYILSGLGGKGKLQLSSGFIDQNYFIHAHCEAGITKMFQVFNFEGLSCWERENEVLKFQSFEERDHVKKIFKKWEFSGFLQYTENKKGLVQEREISYSVPEEKQKVSVFDPLSVLAWLQMDSQAKTQKNTIFIFGKQRLMELSVEPLKTNGKYELKLLPLKGFQNKWTKILTNSDIKLNESGAVEEISAPAPLHIGKFHMKQTESSQISAEALKGKIKNFSKNESL